MRNLLIPGLTLALTLSAAAQPCSPAVWRRVDNVPSPRVDPGLVYDPVRRVTMLFGGWNGGESLGDLWEFRDGAPGWARRETAGGPAGRDSAVVVYDRHRRKVLVFGGADSIRAPVRLKNDTWEFDPAAGTWEERLVAAPPSPRQGMAFAYNPDRKRVLVFGGDTSGNGWGGIADTWEWYGEDGTWTRVAVSGPPGRSFGAMAYDPVGHRMILTGGYTSPSDDVTWAWTASGGWQPLTGVPGPSARRECQMVTDTARGVIVLFSGRADTNDTWEFDGVTTQWTRRIPAVSPPARAGSALVYDPANARCTLFGGYTYGRRFGDLWGWNGADWQVIRESGGIGVQGSPALTYDRRRGRVVEFSGSAAAGSLTWEWDGSAWTPITLPGPAATDGAAMGFDGTRVVVYCLQGSPAQAETWLYDGASWARHQGASPPNRRNASMAYDTRRGRVVLSGGRDYQAGYPTDTWEWDGSGWQLAATGGPNRLNTRFLMAYDDTAGRMIGVVTGQSASPMETWEWGAGAWNRIATAQVPPTSYAACMAYSGAFGGVTLLFHGNPSSDLWLFTGSDWVPVQAGAIRGRSVSSMVADGQGRLMVFAGIGQVPGYPTVLDDTWLMECGCYANCDGSTAAPVVNVSDFICFMNRFAAGDPAANCDGSSAPPALNVSDFLCFSNAFAAGCP